MERWRRNGDGRLEDGAMAMQRQCSNWMEMNGTTVMEITMGNGNGQLVGW
jgi:hypothetical protein